MIIYLATNKINGKKYVGLTKNTLRQRKWNHKTNAKLYPRSNTHFHNAIRKYGWEAFEWEEIDNALFPEDLSEKEKYWISKLDTYRNGYNATTGGEANFTQEGLKGEDNPTVKISEEQALEVIDLLFAGELPMGEIAEITNVGLGTVQAINMGKAWKHLYKGKCPLKAGRTPVLRPCKGESHGMSVLNKEQVIEIKRLLSLKTPMTEISEKMNIKYGVIDAIKRGQNWGWLKTEYDDKITFRKKPKLNEEQVKEVKRLLKKGIKQLEIGKMLNISKQTISLISLNKIWKDVTLD